MGSGVMVWRDPLTTGQETVVEYLKSDTERECQLCWDRKGHMTLRGTGL